MCVCCSRASSRCSHSSVDTSFKRATPDGVMHLQMRVAPEYDGKGAVITFHDTTRLVQGQRQAAWRDVARRIAHEIRNPLTPIQLSAERLRRRFSGQITSDRETFVSATESPPTKDFAAGGVGA